MAGMSQGSHPEIGVRKRKRGNSEGTNDAQSSILLLEEQIVESQKNYNHIVTLLDIARGHDSNTEASSHSLALVTLCRAFCKLMALGNLSKYQQASENQVAITQWLNDRLNDYKTMLFEDLSEQSLGSHATALTLLMKLVKEEAEHLQLSEDLIWRRGTFHRVVETLVGADTADASRNEFVEKYVEPFADVRYHTFGHLRSVYCGLLCTYLTEILLETMQRNKATR